MTADLTPAVGYLRLSDARWEEALDGRTELLRAGAADLGWHLYRIIIENDMQPANGDGTLRPASAFKRRKIRLPSGRVELRVVRPGFRELLDEIQSGQARGVLGEDLDRLLRQPRDGEDLLDAVELSGATVRSLSESVTLTNGGTDNERYSARNLINAASKASADTARRVSAGRQRHAGRSYGGGIRPYGYRPDPDAPRYHKTLIIVEAEAAIMRAAAADLLRGVSLKAIIRDLRERHVPTVTGAEWNTRTLRDVLLKPTAAGLAVKGGELVPAPWPAIFTDRGEWERLCDLLRDPDRRTSTANEPRWLVSVWATCGVCGKPLRVGGAGRGRGPAYVGADCGHIRRDAVKVDELVRDRVLAILERPDAADLLRPPPRASIDEPRLRAERRKIIERADRQADMNMRGALSDSALEAGQRAAAELIAGIDRQLATTSEPDPLEEFRGQPARVVWEALSLPRRRAVVQALLASVSIHRTQRGGRFDPSAVKMPLRPEIAA